MSTSSWGNGWPPITPLHRGPSPKAARKATGQKNGSSAAIGSSTTIATELRCSAVASGPDSCPRKRPQTPPWRTIGPAATLSPAGSGPRQTSYPIHPWCARRSALPRRSRRQPHSGEGTWCASTGAQPHYFGQKARLHHRAVAIAASVRVLDTRSRRCHVFSSRGVRRAVRCHAHRMFDH